MNSALELKTNRLTLREINESDAELIVKLRSDPAIYRYFANPHKITIEEHVKWYFNLYCENDKRIDWVGIDKDNKRIGVFGIKKIEEQYDVAEISYILDPNEYGKGYAQEAVECVMEYCRDKWSTKTIIAKIHQDNTASIHFAEKLGYIFEYKTGDFMQFKKNLYQK